ncbi:unnamed protein product [Parnassius mnemosyne]|uniref:Farnesoic acid O-methyl transferase domain-containing protein n=2 Tax=Parnassius mnemosyne TaxID=213953 RepID=A0AAV1M5J8_9NEOP
MGDTVEICTWPDHQNVFYEITSSALVFFVKASRNAVIGLSKKPNPITCDYWIVISNHPHSYIKKGTEPRTKVHTPDILSAEEYRKFWIAWNGGFIRLGHGEDSTPIIICANKVPGLNYITFDVRTRRARNSVHWKFELPPMPSKPKLKTLMGGDPQWFLADHQLPDGAIIGGYEKEALYIIRAPHRGSFTPGKFVPSLGLGFIPWGGEANEKSEFEVLCGYNCIWVPSRVDKIPVGAVVGGFSEDDGREKLYVGRAAHEGHLIPGKVQPSHRVCYIPYNNKEIAKSSYEILIVPNSNTCYANKFFVYNIELESASESESDESDNDTNDESDNYSDNDIVYNEEDVE